MHETLGKRLFYVVFGAAAGYALWLLAEAVEKETFGERSLLFFGLLLCVFSAGFFAMAGGLGVKRALIRALPLGLLVAGLGLLVSLRWNGIDGLFEGPGPALALIVLALLPVPFLIAEGVTGSWRNYPALFSISWAIVVQAAIALCFTWITWMVIWVSVSLFNMVGLGFLEDILFSGAMPVVVSGAAFGLAVAVVSEISDHLSPRLVHHLLRLLLPVVALVSAVFALAALLRGFGDGFAGLSPALTLLAMAAAGITLIAAALDESEAEAARNPLILWSARAMALLLPVLAGMALWAVAIRLQAYGLSPNRLLVLVLAILALAYGLAYAAALARGAQWAAQIRAANPWLALAVIGAAALWLSPLLNAEALSAQSMAARLRSGEAGPGSYFERDFRRLGRAGETALVALEAEAQSGGKEQLQAALAVIRSGQSWYDPQAEPEAAAGEDPAVLLAEVEALLPVSPASATGGRSNWLQQLPASELSRIRSSCQTLLESGKKGCVMVIADLLPEEPGEEAVLLLADESGWAELRGLATDEAGGLRWLNPYSALQGRSYDQAWLRAQLDAWQEAPPPLTPARLNQIGTGDAALIFLP
ncbi:DUF4153 domain-containing protein [Pseudogemmobacter faecipullorum]|uniref:NADH dehydrogenase subunit 6 n=1 Tax=Pseudogemmobacter faecipullorum TaxID=2755041 RepID=A0ABS8CKK5_9RHOB|nr:DUF4153 domain-containing protein [Pseudogemmobacter faecipullorum]MCB5409921.1 NADH dehydrogenase subunit 6 [Pseudogemmobacter faecipullorum]